MNRSSMKRPAWALLLLIVGLLAFPVGMAMAAQPDTGAATTAAAGAAGAAGATAPEGPNWPKAAAGLGLGFAAIGSGFGLGRLAGQSAEAIGRQPEASGKIMGLFFVGAGFIEALTIYALVAWFTA